MLHAPQPGLALFLIYQNQELNKTLFFIFVTLYFIKNINWKTIMLALMYPLKSSIFRPLYWSAQP